LIFAGRAIFAAPPPPPLPPPRGADVAVAVEAMFIGARKDWVQLLRFCCCCGC